MEELLKDMVAKKKREGVPGFVIRNLLKEYLQYPVLEFIYSRKEYHNFVFTGGSCLRICFGAPRLSEDLDFGVPRTNWKKLDLEKMSRELKDYFKNKYLISVKTKYQGKKRIYLKFPILKSLNIASASESDWLYVKIEASETAHKKALVEITPVSRFGFNLVIRNYPLEILMAGKLNAILSRVWFKGKDSEVDIKGRDFYDLFWYLEKGISPNFEILKKTAGVSDWAGLKKVLKERIEKNVTSQKLAYDLKNFFPDQNFIADFCKNYKKIIFKYLK